MHILPSVQQAKHILESLEVASPKHHWKFGNVKWDWKNLSGWKVYQILIKISTLVSFILIIIIILRYKKK